METIHVILTFLQHARMILLAIPERKLLPICSFAPIVLGGSILLWHYIKWRLSSDENA